MTDIEESYWTSPVRESAKFNVTKGERLKAASPVVYINGPVPLLWANCIHTYNYGCELVSFFFVTGIAEPSDGERRRLTPTFVHVISNLIIKGSADKPGWRGLPSQELFATFAA